MEDIRKNKMNIVSILLLAAATLFGIGLVMLLQLRGGKLIPKRQQPVDNGIFTANYGSGFYSGDLDLEFTLNEGIRGSIFFTTDCSEPVPDGAMTYLCGTDRAKAQLHLEAASEETVNTFRVLARYKTEEGSYSELRETFTYIVGTSVMSRFDLPVISIAGDPGYFYDYNSGILVGGKMLDDFLAEHPEVSADEGAVTGNFTMRGKMSERKVHLQMFDSDGSDMLDQNGGLRIFGNFSRAKNQKSFQLFARKEYDEHGSFRVEAFPELRTVFDGTIQRKFNRLWLRNSGDDFNHGFIRDSLVQSLAFDSGFEMTAKDRPAAVYLNNEYYGIAWMREPFHSGMIEDRYGDIGGEVVTVVLNETAPTVTEEADPEKRAEIQPWAEEYQEIYQRFARADLTDEQTFAELSEKIDIDNYLRYYAIQIYIGAVDWPFTNVKAYRFVSDDGTYEEEGLFDGRYRYLLFDSDITLALEDHYTAYAADADTVELLIRTNHSLMFNGLMARKDCRDIFVNAMCDLMNSGFRYEHAKKTLDEMNGARWQELSYYLSHSDKPAEGVSMESVAAEVAIMDDYLRRRPENMYRILETDFPVFYPYHLILEEKDHLQIQVGNCRDADTGFDGIYYSDCGLRLKADAACGYRFDHWEITGGGATRSYEGEELTLSFEELKDLLGLPQDADHHNTYEYEDRIRVKAIAADDPEAGLRITSVHVKGSEDTVVITNTSGHRISAEGMRFEDVTGGESMLLPTVDLEAGKSLTLIGAKAKDRAGAVKLHFSLVQEREFKLTDASGKCVDSLYVPDLTEEDTNYVLDLYSGKYSEAR